MSLTSALSNAGSGLAVAARSAELVATNVANALTEGYGRREIQLSTANLGGNTVGVRVVGVDRVVDQVAINQRRLSEASFGNAQTQGDFFRSLEGILGTPDQPNSLTSVISSLEASIISATANPSSESQLKSAVDAVTDLAQKISNASSSVQLEREKADRRISDNIDLLNTTLNMLDGLNDQIVKRTSLGGDIVGLMDERQLLIDQISNLIPLQELPRDNGRIALVTSNGSVLLDDNPAQFEFSRTFTITAELSIFDGNLSDLELTGAASKVGSVSEIVAGGALAADFTLRDELAVQAQAELDSLASNLIARTSDPLVDPTIGLGPGIFTDAGGAFDPLNEVGVSGRLTANAILVDEPWRLRDGIGAAGPSTVADPQILSAVSFSLSDDVVLSSVNLGRTFSAAATDIVSRIATARNSSELREGFVSSQIVAFTEVEQAVGVDTDQEMQKLLAVEQAYAANARVIQTIDELMQTLLRI